MPAFVWITCQHFKLRNCITTVIIQDTKTIYIVALCVHETNHLLWIRAKVWRHKHVKFHCAMAICCYTLAIKTSMFSNIKYDSLDHDQELCMKVKYLHLHHALSCGLTYLKLNNLCNYLTGISPPFDKSTCSLNNCWIYKFSYTLYSSLYPLTTICAEINQYTKVLRSCQPECNHVYNNE